MASAGGIKAGKAFVELYADDNALSKGLKAASDKLKSFGAAISDMGKKIAAIGSAITAPLILAAQNWAKAGNEIYEMSQKTGISVEALSRLSFAADLSGSSADEVSKAIGKMQKTIAGVADVTEGTTGSLANLGINVQDIINLSPDKQFLSIAEKIAAIQNPAERTAAAMGVFGKSGANLIPMIQEFTQLSELAERLGFVKSTEGAKSAHELYQMMLISGKAVMQIWNRLGEAVAPVIKDMTIRVIEIAKCISNWVKNNEELIRQVFKIATYVAGAGTAIYGLGKVISGLGWVVGIASGVIGFLGSVLGFILSPIGLVVIALGGLVYYFLDSTGNLDKAINSIKSGWASLKDDVVGAVGGIKSAIAGGNIDLAVKILWATIRMEWDKGISYIKSLMAVFNISKSWEQTKTWLSEFGTRIVESFSNIWSGLGPILSDVGSRLVQTFLDMGAMAGKALANAVLNGAKITEIKLHTNAYRANLGEESEADVKSARADYASGKLNKEQLYTRLQMIVAVHKQMTQKFLDDEDKAIGELTGASAANISSAIADVWSKPFDTSKAKDAATNLTDAWGKDMPKVQIFGELSEQDKAAMVAGQAKVDKDKAELQTLLEDAKKVKPLFPDKKAGDDTQTPTDYHDLKNSIKSVGMFNASAAWGIGGQDKLKDIEKNTKATVVAIERLSTYGGSTFA